MQDGLEWYRELRAEDRSPIADVRRGLWGILFREYLEGLVEKRDTGISPWCIEVAKKPSSTCAIETRVWAPPGLWWMVAERLTELWIPYRSGAQGQCVIHDPLHQVDLHYHTGVLERDLCRWALSYLTGRGAQAKKKNMKRCLAAYNARRLLKEEELRAKGAQRYDEYVQEASRKHRRSQCDYVDSTRVMYPNFPVPQKFISELEDA